MVRIWWSLYCLERQISITTGRPSVVVDSSCSVPLPKMLWNQQIPDDVEIVYPLQIPTIASGASPVGPNHPLSRPVSGRDLSRTPGSFSDPKANSGAYFKATVQMGIITQSILASLYSVGTMIRSPDELQQDIIELSQRLDNWVTRLPVEFNFQMRHSSMNTSSNLFFRERTLLTFQLCSARILLTRPCLGRFGPEATVSTGFTQSMAGICVDAARMEIDLLPDQPHPRFIYELGPWWTIVHNLMQVLAVLLLALSYSSAKPQDNTVLADYCMKVIRWLRAMDDPLAKRAYTVALSCFELVADRLSLPMSNLWLEEEMAFAGHGHGVPIQASPPEDLPIASIMGHGPAQMTGHAEVLVGSSFLSYGSLATSNMHVPPVDEQLYDELRITSKTGFEIS